jgi:hypothetical protein
MCMHLHLPIAHQQHYPNVNFVHKIITQFYGPFWTCVGISPPSKADFLTHHKHIKG